MARRTNFWQFGHRSVLLPHNIKCSLIVVDDGNFPLQNEHDIDSFEVVKKKYFTRKKTCTCPVPYVWNQNVLFQYFTNPISITYLMYGIKKCTLSVFCKSRTYSVSYVRNQKTYLFSILQIPY